MARDLAMQGTRGARTRCGSKLFITHQLASSLATFRQRVRDFYAMFLKMLRPSSNVRTLFPCVRVCVRVHVRVRVRFDL